MVTAVESTNTHLHNKRALQAEGRTSYWMRLGFAFTEVELRRVLERVVLGLVEWK